MGLTMGRMAVASAVPIKTTTLPCTLLYGWVKSIFLPMIIFNPKKKSKKSISNIEALCHALDINEKEFDNALAIPNNQKYKKNTVPKSDGSLRDVYNPHFLIRKIQRRINKRILSDKNMILWPTHLFGSIPNQNIQSSGKSIFQRKDYVECARQHCQAKSILSLDIKNFFENIHQDTVIDIFKNFFHYPEDVSKLIAEICCFNNRLVQGALTSSYLASLCLHDKEGEVVKRLHRKNLTYTRYVDDITVSSKIANFDFDYAEKIITELLLNNELSINQEKTKIQYVSSTALTVHGLRVGYSEPRLPSEETG